MNETTSPGLRGLLAGRYAEQLQLTPSDYVRYHSSPLAIASRVNSFESYRDYLPAAGRVLDWGCQHAPDATMVRATFPTLSVTGCDFLKPDTYVAFWQGLDFVELKHHVTLPFPDQSFDCVIGGGVLEHTAHDYESLKELWRILKLNGRLIITHLPNWLSYTEFLIRVTGKSGAHRRLYGVREIEHMLKHTGFYPLTIRRHRFLPTNTLQSVTRFLSPMESRIERVWPLSLFNGDIMAVAERVQSM